MLTGVPVIDDGVSGIVKSTVPECEETVYDDNDHKIEKNVHRANWSFVPKQAKVIFRIATFQKNKDVFGNSHDSFVNATPPPFIIRPTCRSITIITVAVTASKD